MERDRLAHNRLAERVRAISYRHFEDKDDGIDDHAATSDLIEIISEDFPQIPDSEEAAYNLAKTYKAGYYHGSLNYGGVNGRYENYVRESLKAGRVPHVRHDEKESRLRSLFHKVIPWSKKS